MHISNNVAHRSTLRVRRPILHNWATTSITIDVCFRIQSKQNAPDGGRRRISRGRAEIYAAATFAIDQRSLALGDVSIVQQRPAVTYHAMAGIARAIGCRRRPDRSPGVTWNPECDKPIARGDGRPRRNGAERLPDLRWKDVPRKYREQYRAQRFGEDRKRRILDISFFDALSLRMIYRRKDLPELDFQFFCIRTQIWRIHPIQLRQLRLCRDRSQ